MRRPGGFEIVCLLALAHAAVRLLPLKIVARVLLASRAPVRPARPGEVEALAAAVAASAARCRPRPACLARSLVFCHLLVRRGLDAVLVVGVLTGKGQLAAHAWVEHERRRIDLLGAQGSQATFGVLCRIGRHGTVVSACG